MKNLSIIGNGMAACRLLEELVRQKGHELYQITVYGDEAGGAYNRIMLGKVLGGETPAKIVMRDEAWYAEHGITLRSGVSVSQLDTAARKLELANGERHRYDIAVIATGSRPVVPPLVGMTQQGGDLRPGVFVYRTMDDCLKIRAFARPGDNAVILGGGLLGLEAGKVLSDRGLHVTVVHLSHGLMNTQLDFVGGEMLRRQIESTGMFVRTGRTIEEVVGEQKVEGVILDDGQHLSADLVVAACGVRPRVEVARASNIPINKGILVNDTLATQVPGVYALGECAEHQGKLYGLVAPAWEQAEVLSKLLSGAEPKSRYRGSKLYSRLKVAGVEVASMGTTEPKLDSDEVIQVVEERRQAYRKLIIRDQKLIGAMFVGEVRAAATLIGVFDRNDDMPDDPLEALCSFSSASSAERTLCNCHKVSQNAVVISIQAGADSVEAVGQQTRAGTGCGSCRNDVAELVKAHRKPAKLAESA
jgi:nitrite reductase (NADH) large subunit